MPNHIHMILKIDFKYCVFGEDGRLQVAPTISRVIQQFKSAVTKKCGVDIWQKSFYDHIIRSRSEYSRIWEYIQYNPINWINDEYYVNHNSS